MTGDVKSTHTPASGGKGKIPVRHLRLHFIISTINNQQSHFVDTCALYRKHFPSDCDISNPDTRPEGNGKNMSNVEIMLHNHVLMVQSRKFPISFK